MGTSDGTAGDACTVIELNLKAMKFTQPEMPQQMPWCHTPTQIVTLRNTLGIFLPLNEQSLGVLMNEIYSRALYVCYLAAHFTSSGSLPPEFEQR
jgi:hypothetical protein